MEGLREAGDIGGVELEATAASSVVALSSVARAELRPAVASLVSGDGVELRGRGQSSELQA
jgi:hypothetical protein